MASKAAWKCSHVDELRRGCSVIKHPPSLGRTASAVSQNVYGRSQVVSTKLAGVQGRRHSHNFLCAKEVSSSEFRVIVEEFERVSSAGVPPPV